MLTPTLEQEGDWKSDVKDLMGFAEHLLRGPEGTVNLSLELGRSGRQGQIKGYTESPGNGGQPGFGGLTVLLP